MKKEEIIKEFREKIETEFEKIKENDLPEYMRKLGSARDIVFGWNAATDAYKKILKEFLSNQ